MQFLGILSKLWRVIMIYRIFFFIPNHSEIKYSFSKYLPISKMLENRFHTLYIICSAIVSFMYNKSCIYVAGFRTKVKCSYGVSNPVASKSFTFLCVLLLGRITTLVLCSFVWPGIPNMGWLELIGTPSDGILHQFNCTWPVKGSWNKLTSSQLIFYQPRAAEIDNNVGAAICCLYRL